MAGLLERRLYVAVPGIRNYLEYGGHGILVLDPDHGYRCLRRVPGTGLDSRGVPMNVKGIVANAQTQRLYVTTLQSLACYDLRTDRLLWERPYPGGCDRPAITPDGSLLFLPSLESTHWNIEGAEGGEVLRRLDGHQAAHNTLVSLDGARAFLADRHSTRLNAVDVATRTVVATRSDETGATVQSEKMVEVQFEDGHVVQVGDQFGIGRFRPPG